MNNSKLLCIFLILIIILIIISFILNCKETYSNYRKIKLRNVFSTDIFDNKTVFLIANNPNVSKKTQDFLNNYDYKNSLIVRFNGYKPKVRDYCNGKTDIMVYRKHINGFHGYKNNDYNKNIINVFTKDLIQGKEKEFDKYYFVNQKKYINLPSSYTLSERFSFDELNYPKKCKCSWSTGFNFLIYLLHLKNIKKIYLIGYTFHTKKDGCHCELWEYNYFKENIENKYNLEMLV